MFSFYFALIVFAFVLFIKSPGTRVTLICFLLYFIVFLYSSVSIVSILRLPVGVGGGVAREVGVQVRGVALKNPPEKSSQSQNLFILLDNICITVGKKHCVVPFVRYMWSSFQPNPIQAGPLPTTLKRPSSLGKALRTSSALNFQPMSSKPL